MLEAISVLEVISIVQLHILVCLPNIDDSHFDKMATILQEKWILLCSGCGSGYMVVFCVCAGEALMSIQLVVGYNSSSISSSTTWHQRRVVRTVAIAKKFQLVDTFEQRTPTTPPETNWKLCLVCQEETTESLVCPVLSKCRDPGSGYTTMAANLVKFDELGKLPITVQLQRLDEGQGVEATMVAHQASGIKHVCSNTITQCYEEQRRDPSQAAQHLAVVTVSQTPRQAHQITLFRSNYQRRLLLFLWRVWHRYPTWSSNLLGGHTRAEVCSASWGQWTPGQAQHGWYGGSVGQVPFQVIVGSLLSCKDHCRSRAENWPWRCNVKNRTGWTGPVYRGNPPRRGHRPSLQTRWSCKAIHDKNGTSRGCFVQES